MFTKASFMRILEELGLIPFNKNLEMLWFVSFLAHNFLPRAVFNVQPLIE